MHSLNLVKRAEAVEQKPDLDHNDSELISRTVQGTDISKFDVDDLEFLELKMKWASSFLKRQSLTSSWMQSQEMPRISCLWVN
jgi:hypothetical protein